jgi:hypothetical protein
MKIEDVINILTDLGWFCSKDEVGDFFCLIEIDRMLIQIIPSLSKRSDHVRVALSPSISSLEFSRVSAFIMGDVEGFEPIITGNFPVEKISNIERHDIERLSKKVLDWASSQNLLAGLENYRNLPTNSKGARPLRHLASLALAGNFPVLDSYKRSFESGDRLDFVPYITIDMICRALHWLEQRKTGSGPEGSPRI